MGNNLRKKVMESHTKEEKCKVQADALMKERTNLKKEVPKKVEQLKKKEQKT